MPDDASAQGLRVPVRRSGELGMRVVSALVLIPIVLGALAWGGLPFAAVWIAAGGLFAAEWLAMSRTEPVRRLAIATGAIIVVTALIARDGGSVLPLAAGGGIGLLALAGLARDARGRLNAVAGLCAGLVIAVVPSALRDDPAIGIVGPAWMFAVVWCTDIAAYFAGRSLGGPKLMPKVSPKKTWSGAAGGLVAATLAGLVTVLLARRSGWSGFEALPLWTVVAGSALASIASQAGDLLESGLKRRCGVKDSGAIIPGHGGVMDRLDGFLAVALLVGAGLLALRLASS